MTPTSNPISEVVRAPIVARLQVTLSALLSLAATMWTAHWNVRGLDYEGARKRFGKIVEDAHEAADQVAEMMRQLGGEPVATVVGSILIADGRYGTLVSGALSKLLGGLRQDIAATSVDLVAQNLLIEIATTMQKHLMAVESGR